MRGPISIAAKYRRARPKDPMNLSLAANRNYYGITTNGDVYVNQTTGNFHPAKL
jgi:hypothetical protein